MVESEQHAAARFAQIIANDEKIEPRDLAQQAYEEWLAARSIASLAGKS